MTTEQILNTFDPLIIAALERLSRFNKPESKDVIRFFGPCFAAITRAADLEPAALSDWLAAQTPESISLESIHELVRSLTEVPEATLEAARARQDQLDRELANERPLTAREAVLLERTEPLGGRTRDSILAEMFEAKSGYIRGTVSGNYAERGERLPDAAWCAIAARLPELQEELDRRDCAAAGVEYTAPEKVNHRSYASPGYATRPV
jgi:hypothetical protein